MANPIVTENQNTGSNAWQPSTLYSTTHIQAYADATTYSVGDTVTFFVSTQVGGTTYTVKIFRMGWYQGYGACLKFTSTTQTGVAQGYYDSTNTTLNNCPTAVIDATTHRIEAGWASSYTWVVPGGSCAGIYAAMFLDANGRFTFVSFVVKGNTTADYVYIRPVTTEQAYNDWGGFSLYTATKATKVSFNRPDTRGYRAANLFIYELCLIKWLEKQGYNLSYLSSLDLHTNSAQITNYKAMLSVGHDEYWTKEMRDGAESALTKGVGLGFIGANASYWQIRFENDSTGTQPNRTMTCYKVLTNNTSYQNDPFYGVDNTRVTTQWRDTLLNRPENTMIGIMYSSILPNGVANYAWTVDASPSLTYLGGTGLVAGQSYGNDLVGYEYDKIFAGGPSNLKTIATTSVLNSNSIADTANTTTYIAPSGALVFASGAISWQNCLDAYRWNLAAGTAVIAVDAMQIFFANIMAGLIQCKTGNATSTGFSGFAMHR